MQANPVLAEVVRGNWIENIHRGAYCVADSSGKVIASSGDIERAIFPRSAIKSMQALALFQSGAVEKFGLDDEAIALACASHDGEPGHVAGVQRMLDKIGCTIEDLECGAHAPTNPDARKALFASGEKPTAIVNNCSGKHAGMLAVAKALDVPIENYTSRDHAVQQLVRAGVEEVIGESLTTDRCGTDGCSIPTWAAPIRAFAQGFARMNAGTGLCPEIASASQRIFAAASNNPFLVRGSDTLDTNVMTAFEGRLMLKIGAEGVFCGAVRDSGLGFALKIDDGNMKAAEVVVSALLLAIAHPNEAERAELEKQAGHRMFNWRKLEVGKVTATDAAYPLI
ncbi:asparaginase [Mariluticola halotolerans]|uniref:asparaginase n=1 Tax=Mariluticola halotolerans TaxID=2909283 RepID=UPI0026E26D1B|nr:asparaginase [Mariluticola halotolerans]UJQ95774.1 asparaginase [Mariluticola halotolerans]